MISGWSLSSCSLFRYSNLVTFDVRYLINWFRFSLDGICGAVCVVQSLLITFNAADGNNITLEQQGWVELVDLLLSLTYLLSSPFPCSRWLVRRRT